jgi:hypothetical protein
MKFYRLLFLLTTALFLFSCDDETVTDETTTTADTTTTTVITEPVVDLVAEDPNTFKATFIGFQLGDVPHFMFKDESGKDWDFTSSMITNFTFEVEMESGDLGPDPKLLNKTFMIKYETKEEQMYADGPIGEVKRIIEATLVE